MAPKRLLLAEDDAVNRAVAKLMLESMGHSVVTAMNGFQVLERLKQGCFDAVLLDIKMPGLGGVETFRRIREAGEPYSGIPIIAVTAHAMAGDRERFLEQGMDGYVSKPYTPEDLRAALSQALECSAGPCRPDP